MGIEKNLTWKELKALKEKLWKEKEKREEEKPNGVENKTKNSN